MKAGEGVRKGVDQRGEEEGDVGDTKGESDGGNRKLKVSVENLCITD